MNATRILWGQVIAVISVTLLGIWSATQWTAHALAHQPELGEPWFWLGPWPIYGIMALELIQNADDAGSKRLFFDVQDDALVVGNDGEFSTCGLHDAECPWLRTGDASGLKRPCNFHAISEMGSRSKLHAAEQIGRFGIGFVSVYQITDTPIVRSSGVELRLNPQTQEVIKNDVGSTVGTQFILPWASSQSEVRDGLNASPTPEDVADKVVEEVDLVLQGSLLFLRHVEHVDLRRNGSSIVSVDIDRAGEDVILRFSPTDITQRWLVLSRQADDILADKELFERFEALTRLRLCLRRCAGGQVYPARLHGLVVQNRLCRSRCKGGLNRSGLL